MSRGSFAGTVGKGVAGAGVGFALYFLFRNLRFGGGFGLGESFGVGEGSGGAGASARPKDARRLNLLLSARGFEWRDQDWKVTVPSAIVTLNDVIARVREGGRSDVALKTAGDVLQGDYERALEGFKQAGIEVFKAEVVTTPPTVSGNGRGEYRARTDGSWR